MTTKNSIWIIGSLHATHKTNPNYSYEHLYTYIDTYKPDYIGIEVRQQDMKEDPDYLSRYYPGEMIQINERYKETTRVEGFDWRGSEMESLPIEYWMEKTPSLKGYMTGNDKVSKLIKRRKALMNQLYDTGSLLDCHRKMKAYLLKLEPIEQELYGHIGEAAATKLRTYQADRDRKIQENIIRRIKENPDKRMVFITGIFHREGLMEALQQEGIKERLLTQEEEEAILLG